MRFRSVTPMVALAVVLGACSGGGDPAAASTSTAAQPATTITTTTAPDAAAGVAPYVLDGVLGLLAGTPLEGLSNDAVARDVLAGCALAGGPADPDAFLAGLTEIVSGRLDAVGEPPGGESSARYAQALGAAYAEVCPEEFGAALAASGPAVARPDPGDGVSGALEALAIGLEGSPFEGLLDGPWPAEEMTPVLVGVCRIIDDGGSNTDVTDMVAGEVLQRFQADQGERDLLTVTIITVAVVFLCPEYTDSVLGP